MKLFITDNPKIDTAFAITDLFRNWNFSNPAEYELDDGLEIVGGSVRLKAQNYTSDANTRD
jgi:hypothetical protein